MAVSLCMIVKNEEDNLPRCLESIKDVVDEMIIVDTGSTDSTVEIAEKYGAKVYHFQWNDNFSDARNFSLEKAACDWILLMDADDELESEDKKRFLELLKDYTVEAYYFETLNFTGDIPGLDVIMNLNVRLVRNHKGYRFEGAIHEQIISYITWTNPKAKIITEKVRVKHYGYLNKNVIEKGKRKRNMQIIGKLLEENENDPFMLFNMGNEYNAAGDYLKALECYEKSYKNFNPDMGFSSKLVMRLVSIYDVLNMNDQELKIIEQGLRYYPGFTDLEFFRGKIHVRQEKYTLAIKSYKRCIEMGEPTSTLSVIIGVGGFRSYFALAEIYFKLGDYDESYNYCLETLKNKADFLPAFYKIAYVLFARNEDTQAIRKKLESFFPTIDEPVCTTLFDIFFAAQHYDIAFDYICKSIELQGENSRLFAFKGKCLLYMKEFKKAYQNFEKIKDESLYENAMYGMILCEILDNRNTRAEKLIRKGKKLKDNKTIIIYNTFMNIKNNNESKVISEDKEESKEYLNIIIELLNTLLKLDEYDLFEKCLQMFNLIESDEVLLRLAKLYYQNGHFGLAYQEFIRSIKLYDAIDTEGLEMMRNAKLRQN